MFDKCKNSKKQGDIGVGEAIAFFLKRGQTVLFPLSDSEPYDLAFDDGKRINKVQVKTTKQVNANKCGGFKVELRTSGGNQSRYTNKKFDPTKVDYLFVLTNCGDRYLIPSSDINAKCYIVLGPDKDKFKIGMMSQR